MTKIHWCQLLNNDYVAIREKRRIMNESYMQHINENYWKNKSQFLKFLCSKNLVVLRRKYNYLDYDASNCSLSNTKDKLRVLKEH